jgi:thiopeptide-type bacteriocin biosynthesis protein
VTEASRGPKRRPEPPYLAADFFVLRTPLLSYDEWLAFGAGLEAPAADEADLASSWARDVARLRERLRSIVSRPEVTEALFVASPSLEESLSHWLTAPDEERGQKIERSLLRYFARMTGRPTPFGLFAGCSVGDTGEDTRLDLAPRARAERHTRLDCDYLALLCADLSSDPAVRSALTVRPNSSLYRAAGSIRYAEARLIDKVRSHHLVLAEPDPFLELVLARAASAARPAELAAALVAADPEITPEEAGEFVNELISRQLLVPELEPAVTGDEPIHDLVRQLEVASPRAAARLASARSAIEQIDRGGVGTPPERYRAIARELEDLGTKVELARLFQVDLMKPSDLVLGRPVIDAIASGVELLHRITPHRPSAALARFTAEFQERYEGRSMPLPEVLDEESGIGFDASSGPSSEAAPLLEGLQFPSGAAVGEPFGEREAFLLRRVAEVSRAGGMELVLSEQDLQALEAKDRSPLPRSFAAMASLLGPLGSAPPRLHLALAVGPSGANLLGRFCHGDPALTERVRRYLRAEEQEDEEAIFAEVVHLPQGRIGNVLLRPLLRGHEIPFLGRSGAPAARTIPISDLWISVEGSRVVLRSKSLGQRVVPRLTTAHAFSNPGNLGVYRFLCALQYAGTQPANFALGPLASLPFLPRIVHGSLVLSPARWNLDRSALEGLTAPKGRAAGPERFAGAQRLRRTLGMPRHVAVADGDNLLPLDFDNALSVETVAQLLKERDRWVLIEGPADAELCVRGPEGRYTHELILPFVRRSSAPASERQARPPGASPIACGAAAAVRRSFRPGSEWLYAKLYAGSATLDMLLRGLVQPLIEESVGGGAVQRWFFIRYNDPHWHLRLRLFGDPARLCSEVLPRLERLAAPFESDGRLWKVQLDTYEREIERYGGPAAIELAEQLFEADSEAVLGIVSLLSAEGGSDARWRLALVGCERMLNDLGLAPEVGQETIKRGRAAFGAEFKADAQLERALGEKYRKERPLLEALLSAAALSEHPLAPGLELFDRRSERLAPIGAALRGLEREGRLSSTVAEIAHSYLHMHANRLLRSAARAQELVIHDLLARLYESRAARSRATRAGRLARAEEP